MIQPTRHDRKTGQELTIDGVKMVFQMTPGTEAPAEMNTFFPQFKAMWMAENTTNTMHNLLTLRGAQVRDALNGPVFLNETIDLYGPNVEVKFQSHHWPLWGNAKIIDYWKKQRDMYKYMHDQTVNLMNKGYIGSEIAEMIQLPPELENYWPNRGYYGSLRHNARAIYQRYMGWYDGNPSDLNNLPPEPAAKKYVEYMGGEAAVLNKAKADFDKGEYRWVAEAVKHVVFANPGNADAKSCSPIPTSSLAIRLNRVPGARCTCKAPTSSVTACPRRAASIPPARHHQGDAARNAVRLPRRAAEWPESRGQEDRSQPDFTDLKKTYGLVVENAVLNYSKARGQARRQDHALQGNARLHPAQGKDARAGRHGGRAENRGQAEAFASS